MTMTHLDRNTCKETLLRGSLFEEKERRFQEVAAYRLLRGQRAGVNHFPLFLIDNTFCVLALSPPPSVTVRVTVTL